MRVFGVASDAPEQWTTPFPPENGVKLRLPGVAPHVYDGSRAMCFTIRFSRSRGK